MDCYTDTFIDQECYTVHHHIWRQAAPGWVGELCLRCLRIRLGRNLKVSDFMTDFPANRHINQEFINHINSTWEMYNGTVQTISR